MDHLFMPCVKTIYSTLPVTTLKSPIFVIFLQLTTVKCELSTWTSEISLMYLVWLLASDTTLFNSELFISSLNDFTFLVTTNCQFFHNTLIWLEWRIANYDLGHCWYGYDCLTIIPSTPWFVTRHMCAHQSLLKICIIKQFIVDYFLAL